MKQTRAVKTPVRSITDACIKLKQINVFVYCLQVTSYTPFFFLTIASAVSFFCFIFITNRSRSIQNETYYSTYCVVGFIIIHL
jgi:hypothetical protein